MSLPWWLTVAGRSSTVGCGVKVRGMSPSRQLFPTLHLCLALVMLFSPPLLYYPVSLFFVFFLSFLQVYLVVFKCVPTYFWYVRYFIWLWLKTTLHPWFSSLHSSPSPFFFSPRDAVGRAGLQPAGHASVHLRPEIPGHSSAGDHPWEEPGHPAPEAHQQVMRGHIIMMLEEATAA